MISARQELDLRPQLERLDRLILRSAGLDPAALTFEFRPLWQMDAASKATVALQKAQATQIYAGLGLWPTEVTARLVEAQLSEDGTYPGGEAIFAGVIRSPQAAADFDPNQPRDPDGRWTSGAGSAAASVSRNLEGGASPAGAAGTQPHASVSHQLPSSVTPKKRDQPGGILSLLEMFNPIGIASAQEIDPEEESRGREEEYLDPTAELRIQRYNQAREALLAADPLTRELDVLSPPDYTPTEQEIARIEAATEAAEAAAKARACAGPPSQSRPVAERVYPEPVELPDVIIKISGGSAYLKGLSFEKGIRDYLDVEAPESSNTKGASVPDGVRGNQAFEVKYVRDYAYSIHNTSVLPFDIREEQRMIQQAIKYTSSYAGGVTYYTNSMQLAKQYTRIFLDADISNFKFFVVKAAE